MGMQPDDQGIFFVLIVQGGPGSGEFVYDAAGNLRSSNVGQATTDPVQGVSCPQGFATYNGFGAVINLLSTTSAAAGFFQYFDNNSAVQGSLILAVASTGGSDPVTGHAYVAGLNGIDPVFGDVLEAVGATLTFLIAATFTQGGRVQPATGSGSTPPNIALFAPEQGQSGHLVMVMQGTSPDGTQPGQLLIAREPTGFTVPTRATSKPIVEIQSDDLAIATVGHGLLIKEGTNARMGVSAAMVAGTITIANTTVTVSTRVFLSHAVSGGTKGVLSRTITAGTSFTINSGSGTDTSTVNWLLLDPA